MKKSVTYVSKEKFTALIEARGLQTKENAGFTQVILGNGYHLYVAKTKGVGRIDLQWAPEGIEGVTHLGEGEKIGRVVAQIDFSQTEDQILATFAACLNQGMALPAWERPKRVMPGTVKAKAEAAPGTDEDAAAKKAARKALIEKVAKEKGVSVSAKADL